VYHAWKAKNSQKTTEKGDSERAPKTLYQYQQSHKVTPTTPVSPPNQNRYFRVPFTKDGMNKGMWYAHFEGEFIRRQMEINGDQRKRFLAGTVIRLSGFSVFFTAKFLLNFAGKDDMQMCELKLSETGLTRKRGAEILEWEFEREWNKEGVDNNI
jgi:myosin VI